MNLQKQLLRLTYPTVSIHLSHSSSALFSRKVQPCVQFFESLAGSHRRLGEVQSVGVENVFCLRQTSTAALGWRIRRRQRVCSSGR